jgi:hypothetical protein
MSKTPTAAQHTAAYKKLSDVVRNSPESKSELHSDPVIGSIVKKLSQSDFKTLSDVVNKQTACTCNPQSNG